MQIHTRVGSSPPPPAAQFPHLVVMSHVSLRTAPGEGSALSAPPELRASVSAVTSVLGAWIHTQASAGRESVNRVAEQRGELQIQAPLPAPPVLRRSPHLSWPHPSDSDLETEKWEWLFF